MVKPTGLQVIQKLQTQVQMYRFQCGMFHELIDQMISKGEELLDGKTTTDEYRVYVGDLRKAYLKDIQIDA